MLAFKNSATQGGQKLNMWNQIVASNLTPLIFGSAFGAVSVVRMLVLSQSADVNAYVIDLCDPMHRLAG